MLDPDNTKINCYTERQSCKDPAEPINGQRSPELFWSSVPGLLQHVWIEQEDQHELQQFSARCPRDAKEQSHPKMQEDAPDEMRASEGPTSRYSEHTGSEERINQPIAGLPKQVTGCDGIPAHQTDLCDAINRSERSRYNPCCGHDHPWSKTPGESHSVTVSLHNRDAQYS